MLAVLYLIFNEGYAAARARRLVRGELCSEAIRLGRLLGALMPDDAEARGLLALMLLHDARREARVDDRGRYVALDRQDRSRWDQGRIRGGLDARGALRRSGRRAPTRPGGDRRRARPGRRAAERDDWARIAELTTLLAQSAPSPVVEVNRAVAVAADAGPQAGLELIARCSPIQSWRATSRFTPPRRPAPPRRRRGGARAAYGRALELTENPIQRAELGRRLAELG